MLQLAETVLACAQLTQFIEVCDTFQRLNEVFVDDEFFQVDQSLEFIDAGESVLAAIKQFERSNHGDVLKRSDLIATSNECY
jgi:hypothetical protein